MAAAPSGLVTSSLRDAVRPNGSGSSTMVSVPARSSQSAVQEDRSRLAATPTACIRSSSTVFPHAWSRKYERRPSTKASSPTYATSWRSTA